MILGINTAQRLHELALVNENNASHERELLGEKIWPDARRDVEDLPVFLQNLLESLGVNKDDIKQVLVVNGPGSFTSLRTGVAFANALAEGLNAELYSIDTFELLHRKTATNGPLLMLLPAGGLDVAVHNGTEVKIGPLAFLLKDHPHGSDLHVVAELPETQQEELQALLHEKQWTLVEGHILQTLGESLLTFGLDTLKPIKTVEPLYLKRAHITLSSDPWKQ